MEYANSEIVKELFEKELERHSRLIEELAMIKKPKKGVVLRFSSNPKI